MNQAIEQPVLGIPADAIAGTAVIASSAVSWGAILGGATAAAAVSLILLILGAGLGFSVVSPWVFEGINAQALRVSTILWFTITQLLASGLGGYLAGRLRTSWIDVHTDEVYFRDTAHGFLTWALATLATAILLGSVISSIIGAGARMGDSVLKKIEIVNVAADNDRVHYFVDALLRRNLSPTAATPPSPLMTSEVARIFLHSLQGGALVADDVRYVGLLVARQTGTSQQASEQHVTDIYARFQGTLRDAKVSAETAVDDARKISAHAALWLFISLLSGAFVASLAATFGGRRRDL